MTRPPFAFAMLTAVLAIGASLGCNMLRIDVVGAAMEPTLMNGASFIKRIVGLPGERLESVEGRISVNGQPLDEPYVAAGNRSMDSWGPITIPAGEFFMMGDNRRNSSDSRQWGTVRRDAVWAKVIDE